MTSSTPAPISTLLPCGKTYTHEWEDTPNFDPTVGTMYEPWKTHDFNFDVTTESCDANPNMGGSARLSK